MNREDTNPPLSRLQPPGQPIRLGGEIRSAHNGAASSPANGRNQSRVIPRSNGNHFHPEIYSRASGLDVMGILVKVAMRKNPRIQLGPIDLSCAITVCAGDLPDDPIIYCSEGFEALTQYRSDEVLGRNCRFLQVPHGLARTAADNDNAQDADVKARLRSDVAARQETQVAIMNYKKSGEPFVNILSIIPVTWESDQIKYLVGFMARATGRAS